MSKQRSVERLQMWKEKCNQHPRYVPRGGTFDEEILLELSVRAYTCLQIAGIETVGALVSFSPKELLEIPGLGPKCLAEILRTLSQLHMSLGVTSGGVVKSLEVWAKDERKHGYYRV
jgi:DNA-directed RNA polymerase alpha subunit